jgi:ABC-type dipeptide/oligopeptide/nickel transport system ATPase component
MVSLIPQSPASALNPALRIETQLAEAWRAHAREDWSLQEDRIRGLFDFVGLSPPEAYLERFPSQISVGQGQRVLIVMALLHSPSLLIADEPTSALDALTQREILDLLSKIGKEKQMSVLFISHDLSSVATFCDRVAILHEGQIVESGPIHAVLNAPQHPFTRRLIASFPNQFR